MVSSMITHHESTMKEKLSNKPSYPVLQGPIGLNQFVNVVAEDQEERTQNQTKDIGKEDPMSHRIIEKRRRDRMNNCLADLSQLIPAEYMKKGRGRVEKTEIIEMAIKHMKDLQSHVSSSAECQPNEIKNPVESEEMEKASEEAKKSGLVTEQYKNGFFECLTETMQYLVVGHGYPPSHGLCPSLVEHLENHCAQIFKGKQVIREVVKNKIKLEVNRFNSNTKINQDMVDRDGSFEETSQPNSSSSNSKYQSSTCSTSNDQNLADRCGLSYTTDSYNSSNGSMYKFKTDIKQRFSAESNGMDLTDYYTPDKKRRRKESSDSNEDRQDVPIFALHANGSYYIPLSMNREVISPMMDNVLTENRSSVIVHPISISVNFQATANPL